MTLYCGIDLHANNSVIAVVNEHDHVVFEQRIANDLALIIQALQPFEHQLHGCVVESTYNWYWLVDGLMDAGVTVHLAHTAAVPQYAGLKRTDDKSDARHLAQLLRLGILPTGHIYPKEQRAIRDLLRKRLLLVRQKTLHHLSLQSQIARHTGQRLNANAIKHFKREELEQLLDGPARLAAQLSWYMMQQLAQAIAQLERTVAEQLKPRRDYQLLTSVPGIGQALGSTIILETGAIDRFPSPGHYASYARCVKSERISNGKVKGQGNRKNGNKYLAWAFMEAAHHGAIRCPEIKRYYQRKQATRPLLVAKKAVANKLARACYHMLKQQQPFEVTRAFG